MRRNLLTVLNYFGYFSYAPSCDEIYVFFPKKISKKNLQIYLDNEVKDKKILRLPNYMVFRVLQSFYNHHSRTKNNSRYTLPQYSIEKTQNKIDKHILTIQTYIKLLRSVPCIKFIGITGKSAMRGLQNNDDLDLCIVAETGFLWMTRFISIILAKILGIHSSSGVCLNLFFDESDLHIPQKKQNSYIAHELLQMKPLVDKVNIYQQFLAQNIWLFQYFPNAPLPIDKKRTYTTKNGVIKNVLEHFFKSIQLPIIMRNRAAFFITSTQLWLFKNDFEKKLKRVGLVI